MQLLGRIHSLLQQVQTQWLGKRLPPADAAPQTAAAQPVVIAGTEPGWLRVLTAPQLLQCVKADKALAEIWRQSRQSEATWQRDLLPAIHRYAEFVQLMPASEAHHHAHAGGLLSHTIEMLLAAMTWRNAHLLPEGSEIEVIDSQRDQWTYVVFFAALLHDIAKPMTDLRIQWRCDGMADAVRWMPSGGSLLQIMDQRRAGEYLVDFAPKSQRDYSAHTRLAQTLISRIAPASALSFLAGEPKALSVLEAYLCGQDKDSLVATIVKKADQASTKRALQNGSKARFATAKAVPLVDLLMQAMTSMLQAGTVLPLNRNGAAGWVFEGSVWFVAKRLADSVREWVKTHEPEEAIPGQAKNDRLFDTWQEYGVIDLNPATGQAIWYVEVHGNEAEQGGYTHEFAMLRFPLSKLYAQEGMYPAPMRGHLVIKDKRKAGAEDQQDLAPALTVPDEHQTAAAEGNSHQDAATQSNLHEVAPDSTNPPDAAPVKQAKRQEAATAQDRKLALVMREPAFSKPPQAAAAAKSNGKSPEPKPEAKLEPRPEAKQRPAAATSTLAGSTERSGSHAGPASTNSNAHEAGDDAYLLDDNLYLDMAESAAANNRPATRAPQRPSKKAAGAAAPTVQSHQTGASTVPASSRQQTHQQPSIQSHQTAAIQSKPKPVEQTPAPVRRVSQEFRDLMELDNIPAILPRTAVKPAAAAHPNEPVLLVQQLPDLPGQEEAAAAQEPSDLVVDFMQWVQQGLVSRELKYNEAGAVVHFVPEGMALVSPRIFKDYAAAVGGDANLAELASKAQRELIKCGWHLPGPNRTNIVKYAIQGRGGDVVGNLSCVVLLEPFRWVQPVPPNNPALAKS